MSPAKGTMARDMLVLQIALRRAARAFWQALGIRRGPSVEDLWQAMRPIRWAAYAWYAILAIVLVIKTVWP